MSYLPEGLEHLTKEKKYLKMSQLAEGDNKIRIVQRPIAGWLVWEDKKPLRSRPQNKPRVIGDEKPKEFWALYVWDYSREGLYILEITQAGIIKALKTFGQDPDIGDFTLYDIKINKKGSGMTTKYEVIPLAPKALSKQVLEELQGNPVRLEALFEGGDPWTDLEGELSTDWDSTQQEEEEVSSGSLLDAQLAAFIETVPNAGKLDRFIVAIAAKSKCDPDEFVRRMLANPEQSREYYAKWLVQTYPDQYPA